MALLLTLLPIAAHARKPDVLDAICTGTIIPPTFISPMGEPYRPTPDIKDPEAAWFAAADANHDGKLTLGEMTADADRFFAKLDLNHDGQLLPDEVEAYEQNVAPEIRLYQPRGDGPKGGDKDKKRKPADYGGAIGAGRYAFFNIPNPVASADADINRAVDLAEFRAAVAARFALLDKQQKKALTLADLPRTPAQVAANAACLAIEEAKAKAR